MAREDTTDLKPIKRVSREYDAIPDLKCPKCGSDNLDCDEPQPDFVCRSCGLVFHVRPTKYVITWVE